jgi:hypothetical protein
MCTVPGNPNSRQGVQRALATLAVAKGRQSTQTGQSVSTDEGLQSWFKPTVVTRPLVLEAGRQS